MSNPYLIEGPALISFSGGRTSAYMLRQILDAHGGELPADVHVCFANTGKEREETLRFVHECESRWGVRIRWLEWRTRPLGDEGRDTSAEERFDEVGYNSASRNGEPFAALIERKRMIPNSAERFCTAELKIDAMKQFMLANGYEHWDSVVGLRSDEMRRVAKQQRRNEAGKERWINKWPMVRARVIARTVWRFWLGDNADPKKLTTPLPQGFDLGLYPYEGNCFDCMLKGRAVLMHIERERPGSLDWSIAQEEKVAATASARNIAHKRHRFISGDSYGAIKADVARQPLLIPLDWRSIEFDAECGVGGTDTRIRCGARKAA